MQTVAHFHQPVHTSFVFMYNEVDGAVFRPEAIVTLAKLLEIDRSTTQSLWGPPDIHLPEPYSHIPLSRKKDLLFTPIIRTLSLSAR